MFDFMKFYSDLITTIGEFHHMSHALAGPTKDDDSEPPADKQPHKLEIVNNFLHGDHVVVIPSKRTQKLAVPHIEGIVWHWTDTLHGTGMLLSQSIREAPKPNQHVGSWHIAIDSDTIYQSIPFNLGSWHAGGTTAGRVIKDPNGKYILKFGSRDYGANSYFAGIEMVNAGEVRKVGNKWLAWPYGNAAQEAHSGKSAEVPNDQVVPYVDWNGHMRHYHAFTEFQINAAKMIVRALKETYGLIRENCNFSHHQIDPSRRDDPGPMWTSNVMPGILSEVYP